MQSLRSRWVLFIEDSQDQGELCTEALADLGFNVKTASDGVRGIESARDMSPAVVIVDLGLPDLVGWEVIRRLKDDRGTKDIPIIVLTALRPAGGPERASRAGCARYLLKPCLPAALADEIRQVLQEREAARI